MLNKNLVSIIIPVYNGSNYMREAIDSAIAQTYKNIEIIVVNDGSTDNTEEIAKSYGDKIRYYKKENGGVATALNLAIKKSKGKYISWLSHDDVYYPDKIKKQIKIISELSNEKQYIIYSSYDIIDKYSKIISSREFEKEHPLNKLNSSKFPLIKGLIHGCTLLIPKICFDEIGYFDKNLKVTQDYDLWYKIFPKCEVVFLKDKLIKSREHEEQGSKVCKNEYIEECSNLWINMLDNLSIEEKIFIDDSVDNFYKEIKYTMSIVGYKKVVEYLERKIYIRKINSLNIDLNKKNEIVLNKEIEIKNIKESKSFRIGSLFFRSIKNPYKILMFPINFINIIFSKKNRILSKKINEKKECVNDYILNDIVKKIEEYIEQKDSNRVLIFTPTVKENDWKGVYFSVKKLFSESNIIMIPDNLSKKETMKICQFISNNEIIFNKIIFNGMTYPFLQIADYIKEANLNIRCSLLYHGSFSQMANDGDKIMFKEIYKRLKDKTFVVIGTFKEDVYEFFLNKKINSCHLINNVDTLGGFNMRKLKNKNTIDICLMSNTGWVKNIYNQAVAGILLDNVKMHVQNKLIFDFLDEEKSFIEEGHMKHNDFLKLLSKMDLCLYISFSECSPIVPMESSIRGIPCFVSSSTHLYDEDDILKRFLYINELDNPKYIKEKIEKVLLNYEDISKRVIKIAKSRNRLCDIKKIDFLKKNNL